MKDNNFEIDRKPSYARTTKQRETTRYAKERFLELLQSLKESFPHDEIKFYHEISGNQILLYFEYGEKKTLLLFANGYIEAHQKMISIMQVVNSVLSKLRIET